MAKGLNTFTGLEYTPAALSFPLRERQWRMGEIAKLREQIDDDRGQIERARSRIRTCPLLKAPEGSRIAKLETSIKDAAARIPVLEDDIAAIDRVLAMHPHKVDLSQLKPVRKRQPDLLPRGHLERSILNILRSASGSPLTTVEIATAVALEHSLDTTPSVAGRQRVREACVKCLNYLAGLGNVERLHSKKTYGDGFWIISGKDDLA
jgi:hypothetical protein